MTHSNPLIAKWEEIHNPKKEEPKPQKPPIVEYVDNGGSTPSQEVIEKLRKLQPNSNIISASNTSVSIKPKPLTSYDPHSTEDSFLQVAELVKQNKAKIISMNMSVDTSGLFAKTISFEVMVADWDTP
jgi:hypothetical protein